MSQLSATSISIQRHLFPALEDEIGELPDKERKFVRIIELIETGRFLVGHLWCGVGRKPHSRQALAKALTATQLFNLLL